MKNRWPVISISQYDTFILKEILKISSNLGINWAGPYEYKYRYNNCTIRIYNRENVEKFLKKIPSLNPIKLKQRKILCQKFTINQNMLGWFSTETDGSQKD